MRPAPRPQPFRVPQVAPRRPQFPLLATLVTTLALSPLLGGACGGGDPPTSSPGGGGSGGQAGAGRGGSGGQAGSGHGGSGGQAGSGGASGAGGGGGQTGGAQAGGGGSTGGTSGSGGAPGASGGAGGAPDAGAPADTALPVCNYPEWNRTASYKAGEIVMYMGKPYVVLFDTQGTDPTISTYFWGPYKGCTPPPPPAAVECPALDKLLPEGEKTFKAMFAAPFMGAVPLPAYSYGSLCTALAHPRLTGFAASGNATQDKRELAAFFANVALETAYLTAIDERGNSASAATYHGRGSLQITGRAIYAAAGAALGLELADRPQLGSTEGVVWQTGIWYWLQHANPSVAPPNNCHAAIAASDFGRTVRIIKGDCASSPDRANQYRKNATLLGIEPGKTSCP